jgi:hypothetical protein
MKKILQVLNSIAPISETDCHRLGEILHSTCLQKGDYWIKTDRKNQPIGFIEEGYLRKFYLKEGKDITDFFYFENDFSADLAKAVK